jgi:hypothetical protein
VDREQARAAMLEPSTRTGSDATAPAGGRGLDLRRLLSLAWPERWLLIVASVGLVVSSSANLVIIGVAGRMVDVLVKRPEDADQVLVNDLLYLCVTFVTASFMTFVRYVFRIALARYPRSPETYLGAFLDQGVLLYAGGRACRGSSALAPLRSYY